MPLEKIRYRKPNAPAVKKAQNNIERGSGMARAKRRKARRRMSGEVAYYGGRKKARRRSRRFSGEVAYYGGASRPRSRRMSGASKKIDIMKPAINTAVAIGGGIAGRMAKNLIPIEDARIKAAIPVVLGIVISMMSRGQKVMENLGFGMAAIGGAELMGVLFPNVALLQGDNVAQVAYSAQDIKEALDQGLISQDEANTLSQAAGYMGMIEDFSGQDDMDNIGPGAVDMAPEVAEMPWETTENAM